MELYSAPPSYYSMIARLALNESGIPFHMRYMDIHIAKEQLSLWYTAVNPHMTVPTLVDGNKTLIDSRDILALAAKKASDAWADTDPNISLQIEKIVDAHYQFSIEQFTFGKMMQKHFLLKKLFPIMLSRIIKKLKAELSTTVDPQAVHTKIAVNEARLAYFTEGDLNKKLEDRREEARAYIQNLPQAHTFLFGDKPSSADIVTAVFFARLNMIGEDDLIKTSPSLSHWFNNMENRPAFIKSDIWLHFTPWRIILKH